MRSLVIGGAGQDGVLLSSQLLAAGHEVTSLSPSASPLASVRSKRFDIGESGALDDEIGSWSPDFIYYLAAFHRSSQTETCGLRDELRGCLSVNTSGFCTLLDAVERLAPRARVVYASSCRIFGLGDGRLLDEEEPRRPVCPYGISKVAGMGIGGIYRARGMFVASAILFNHESELRPSDFVSKKLALAAVAAKRDPSVRVTVGSLDARADWGAARDYTRAMQAIAGAEQPFDFIVASGELRTVADLAEACFATVGLDYRDHVDCAGGFSGPRWMLRGNAEKLRKKTGWVPQMSFVEMVRDLVARTEDRLDEQRASDFHSYL